MTLVRVVAARRETRLEILRQPGPMRSGLGELAGDEHENGEGCCGVKTRRAPDRDISVISKVRDVEFLGGCAPLRHSACQHRCDRAVSCQHHRTRKVNDELYGAFSLLRDIACSTISAAMTREAHCPVSQFVAPRQRRTATGMAYPLQKRL